MPLFLSHPAHVAGFFIPVLELHLSAMSRIQQRGNHMDRQQQARFVAFVLGEFLNHAVSAFAQNTGSKEAERTSRQAITICSHWGNATNEQREEAADNLLIHLTHGPWLEDITSPTEKMNG